MSWQERGECNGTEADLFFPEGTPKQIAAASEEAISICNGCSVLRQCREYAIENEAYGVWGGLTENEREVIRSIQGKPLLIPKKIRSKRKALKDLVNVH
jgi:WhiB family redox-sensing transcriptional regulator